MLRRNSGVSTYNVLGMRLEWRLLPHCKTRIKVGVSVDLQALLWELNKQERRQMAQLYIVESLACCMSPYSLPLGKVWFMVCVTL
jgi:hypothetical protein